MNNIKNQTKKVTSIAIKLNSVFVSKLFFKLLVSDILIIAIVIGFWCVESEMSYFGKITEEATRSLNFSNYTVILSDGETMVKQTDIFLYLLKNLIIAISSIQGIMILKEIIFGTAKIRKILKPLNDIAETASKLSSMSFDDEKVQNLEEAISKISPVVSDAKIHTGDSELHGLEEAINNLLERMRESYRQQARFVSDASHELRTPISVIQGYANMLDRWGKNDEKVLDESIAAIKSESENMKILVEQLLFLARGINGKTKLNRKGFILNDMMNEVFEESKMIDQKHIYKFESYDDVKVYADESLLKQVIRILIENAIKYTDENEAIILRVGISDNNEPYFSVQDNGIGMDEQDVPHIFERFFRADTARDRKTGGTGLGLSIAKWIADSHNGYFSVISRKDIGTRITMFIPLK